MDRLGRSVIQASEVLELAQRQRWDLVVCDMQLDLSTPSGRAMAQMLSVFAELERSLISERTKAALAAAKARGTRLGRPREIDPALLTRIVAMRSTGLSYRRIAAALTAEGVPTVRGGTHWNPSTIGGLLESVAVHPCEPTLSASEAT